uniref:DDE_3 domain-containing protein n=1 Tax=Heterorhabditis bacteriophora TaxID=37862 RepID=A0A1I7XBH2_HETBA
MLNVFGKELGLVCKSTKSGHLIRSGNKEKRLQFCNSMLELKNRMDSVLYCRILENFYIPFAKNVYHNHARLMQDNDPKHTHKYTRDRLEDWNIRCIDWFPESPDLNPIEKVWYQLKHYLRSEYKPTTKEELMDGIRHFWKTFITVNQCRRYVGHIQKVMTIVQSVNGDHSGE